MLHFFTSNIEDIELPKLFTYPFHYTPHPLCKVAAGEVQSYLRSRTEWHKELQEGKMFGVLVVKNSDEKIGFLAAFSGNLAGSNSHEYFVPAVYDMLQPDDFFKREEAEISAINRKISELKNSDELHKAKASLAEEKAACDEELKQIKLRLAEGKALRNRQRAEGNYDEQALILASQRENAEAQRQKRAIKERLERATAHLAELQAEIEELKQERQQRSAALQMALFAEFRMLNALGEERDLCEIF
ncbi:MAG: RNA pseudouridine synthase, partial [Alistipes sp.]|nr:RNA pseudouridine synthase [Alistipes sp.]